MSGTIAIHSTISVLRGASGVESKAAERWPFGHAASTCTCGGLNKKLRRIAGLASGLAPQQRPSRLDAHLMKHCRFDSRQRA